MTQSYADGYGEGDKLLAIQASVYTDDIDAAAALMFRGK
jgi:hypothetical protein